MLLADPHQSGDQQVTLPTVAFSFFPSTSKCFNGSVFTIPSHYGNLLLQSA
jgi:hypothetical protein